MSEVNKESGEITIATDEGTGRIIKARNIIQLLMFSAESPNILKPFPHLPLQDRVTIESALKQNMLLRQKLLDAFPGREAGIDTERVQNFFRDYNLRTCPFIFIESEAALGKLESEYKQAGVYFHPFFKVDDWQALYEREIDLIVVRTDKGLSQRPKLDQEWYLAHEQAHGSCGHGQCKLMDGDIFRPRVGFSISLNETDQLGDFIEEGFADYMAGLYRSKFADQETLDKFNPYVVGKPTSLDVSVDFEIDGISIPAKYLAIDETGEMVDGVNAFPAYAFELICAARPKFLEKALAARSNPAMLTQVAKEINALTPGLYPALRELKYESAEFRSGLEMVINSLGESALAKNRL